METFQPEWSSTPGASIQNIIDRRNITIDDLADLLGFSTSETLEVLSGATCIDNAIASKLANFLGGTEGFWLARAKQFDEDFNRLSGRDSDERASSWLSSLPLQHLIDSGWVAERKSVREQFKACLQFFNTTDIDHWKIKYQHTATASGFRTSPTYQSDIGALYSWLRIGELSSLKLPCDPWDKPGLLGRLKRMRNISRLSSPARFLPKLQNLCAECGVALVVSRAPKGCRASGATRFVSSDKAMVLMSFRYLKDDHFWFTFFHEIGHLILHEKSLTHVEGFESEPSIEAEANEFASDVLIPEEFREEFESLAPSYKQVLQFSKRIGVSAGIVVGQLQHHGMIERNRLNKLKKTYRWSRESLRSIP